jgi:hypothetical protein
MSRLAFEVILEYVDDQARSRLFNSTGLNDEMLTGFVGFYLPFQRSQLTLYPVDAM